MSDEKAIGRPRAYPDPVVFALAVEEYFDTVKADGKLPTLSGLCIHLGFADKQSFSNYESYEEPFSLTVKKARLRIEDDRHQRLANPACTGIIFDLKANHGWQDKIVTEMSGPDGGPIQTESRIDMSALTDEQARLIAGLPIKNG